MRTAFPPSTRKPSPTAIPFVPAALASNDATALLSSEALRNDFQERVNLPPGQIPCKFYMKGYCSRGSDCWFMHDAAAVPVPMIVEEDGKKRVVEVRENKGKGKAASPEGLKARTDDSEETSEGEPCAICFEHPTTYGLLTNCDHVFCLNCIRSWRSSGNKDNGASPISPFSLDEGNLNKTSKTCPLCRVRSKFTIPSSIFPTPPPGSRSQSSPENVLSANPAKEAIVQRYLDKLGTIPCRYFQESMARPGAFRTARGLDRKRNDTVVPFCPFGNECHYAHTGRAGEKYVFSDRELSNHRRSRTSTRGGRDRSRWMERMLFGVFNDAERNHRHPLFHANSADAQAMLEILIESHVPDWDEYANFHDGEEDEDIDDGDFEDWQDEDEDEDEPEPQDIIDVTDMINSMGFESAREGFYHPNVFRNREPNERLRRESIHSEAYPRRAAGRRETRREDGALVVELDFFQLGRHSAHTPSFSGRRDDMLQSANNDEMPRLVDADDLD